jgi:hypothetical protein
MPAGEEARWRNEPSESSANPPGRRRRSSAPWAPSWPGGWTVPTGPGAGWDQVAASEGRDLGEVARELLERLPARADPAPARALLSAELGEALTGAPRPDRLRRVTDLAGDQIDGASGASVTVLLRSCLETIVATDAASPSADRLQSQLDEAPCVSTAEGEGGYVASHLTGEERWATCASRTRDEVGLAGVLSFRLDLDTGDTAALNVHARDPKVLLGGEAILAGTLLAAPASSAFVAARHQEEVNALEQALASNRQRPVGPLGPVRPLRSAWPRACSSTSTRSRRTMPPPCCGSPASTPTASRGALPTWSTRASSRCPRRRRSSDPAGAGRPVRPAPAAHDWVADPGTGEPRRVAPAWRRGQASAGGSGSAWMMSSRWVGRVRAT